MATTGMDVFWFLASHLDDGFIVIPSGHFLWQAKYKLQLDPTVEELKRLCSQCRKSAKLERVLFHYNGHGVPKPTINGEIWLFNRVGRQESTKLLVCFKISWNMISIVLLCQTYTQYIPLSVYELESWLGTPSIYVFDCSSAGMILNAFCEVISLSRICFCDFIYFALLVFLVWIS